ncbi:MAG: signal peptidase II [Phycisphaeraceae bacterium]|nr:signal peptidase II [Phycisphaeraceae bacterium]
MTKPTNHTQPDAKPTERTGMRWTVWLLFLAIVAASLAADLGLKYWSFENVADVPVKVRTAESGGPEVLVRARGSEKWLVAHEIGLTDPDRPERVPAHDPIVVVPGLLNFQLTLNTGAVFGMGQGARPVFLVVSIVAVFVIMFLLYRSSPDARLYHIGLALILGGALGNLYDRAFYSAVRDMLHMLPSTGLWPWIFNIADVALLCGVGLVLVVSWLSEMKQAKASKQKP